MLPTNKQFTSLPTTIQFIIIVAAIGLIAFVWSITISPIEFIRFERDRQRVRDLRGLSQALEQLPVPATVENKTVYISLPDRDSSCASWDLPPLARDYSYRCASPDSYLLPDGRGWLPLDLTDVDNTLEQLPIDPRNGRLGQDPITGNSRVLFYQYIPGSFSLGGALESRKMLEQVTAVAGLSLAKEFTAALEGVSRKSFQTQLVDNVLAIGTSIEPFVNSRPELVQQLIIDGNKRSVMFTARNHVKFAEVPLENQSMIAENLVNQFIKARLPQVTPESPDPSDGAMMRLPLASPPSPRTSSATPVAVTGKLDGEVEKLAELLDIESTPAEETPDSLSTRDRDLIKRAEELLRREINPTVRETLIRDANRNLRVIETCQQIQGSLSVNPTTGQSCCIPLPNVE